MKKSFVSLAEKQKDRYLKRKIVDSEMSTRIINKKSRLNNILASSNQLCRDDN